MIFYFFEFSSQFFIYLPAVIYTAGYLLENYIDYGRAKKKYRNNNRRPEQKFFRAATRVMKLAFASESARKTGALALEQNSDT